MAPRDDDAAWVEELRLETPVQVIAREAARHLAGEILAWPPKVTWMDATAQATFAPLFAAGAPAPALDGVLRGFQLARWELERAYDAVAHALRNAPPEALGDPYAALAARFLWRWLPEWLYELNERTASRVPRAALISALDQAEDLVRRGRAAS